LVNDGVGSRELDIEINGLSTITKIYRGIIGDVEREVEIWAGDGEGERAEGNRIDISRNEIDGGYVCAGR
jgi:hypothetical protein